MYGKLFSSMYDGTLYGKWQALVTFQQMIILSNSDGVVDMTPHAIAARTSIPLEIIQAGLDDLEKPDPYSRTPDLDGRRLERLDEHRPWGWRIVNHKKYKELISQEQKREADRERMRLKRERQIPTESDTPRHVAEKDQVSRVVADVAHADAYADTTKTKTAPERKKKSAKTRMPDGFSLTPDLCAYTLQTLPDADPAGMFTKFCSEAQSKGWEYVDWAMAYQVYCRNSKVGSGHWAAGQYPKSHAESAVRWT